MYHRSLALLAVVCLALATGGCESLWGDSARKTKNRYEEVMMPLQTGSVLHRRMYVPRGPEVKKKSKKKEAKTPKPEEEASATPAPEEESTPPPDRFR
ncbi:MAG: hypothetical protein ABR611_01185 [Chthoniobacterales bacterium]